MFSLPPDGGIFCFQPGKTINGNLAVRDYFLNGFDNFCGLCNRLCSKNTIRMQSIVFLEACGGSFGFCSPNSINFAAIVSEIIKLPLLLLYGYADFPFL